MKSFLTILFSFFVIQSSFSSGIEPRIMESLGMYSKILGQEVRYSVVLPFDYYKNKRSYPVVYLLHGLGDDETSWLEYGRISQIADNATSKGEIVPMIFVIPQGFRTYYVNDYANTFRYQDMFIQELIPFIDSVYRTKAEKKNRATLGYSMGGFGALILPLKNPEVISNCVPLSISIRTDKQYMEEDAEEWDKQWGSLFGGVGTTGNERITEYYKQNYPFHILAQNDLSKLNGLKIYIDNGDDEYTLCRSNEELHILLRDKQFPHEFRVRNGGHEFSYWRDALGNGLRFISDAFEGKAYRGDLKIIDNQKINLFNEFRNITIKNILLSVYVPSEYEKTTRYYPILYFIGNFQNSEKEKIAGTINQLIKNIGLPPMIAVFIPENNELIDVNFFANIEKELRIREGFRFRALIGFEKGGAIAFKQAINPEQFTACAIFDAQFNKDELQKSLDATIEKSLKRTWFFIVAPDKSMNYSENGNIHMQFRDKDIYHEYRVDEGNGGFSWFMGRLPETLSFIAKKIHN